MQSCLPINYQKAPTAQQWCGEIHMFTGEMHDVLAHLS